MNNLPCGVDINNLIDDLRIFSWEAADILLKYESLIQDPNRKKNLVKTKKNSHPVTLADLKVNEIILKRIKDKYSFVGWNYLSEENVKQFTQDSHAVSDWLWILDPLDGTKDFIQGTQNYAMHLALNYKNIPYLGIVLIPNRNELWISNGNSVWCEGRERKKRMPTLSSEKNLNEMTLVTSKNHSNKILKDLIDKIKFKNIKIMGSIGCKISSIMRGDSDIYISLSLPGESSPKDWDFAAPEAILKTAGGAITNLNNEDLTYSQNNFEQAGMIIASNNNQIHEKLCIQIKEVIKKYEIYPLNN